MASGHQRIISGPAALMLIIPGLLNCNKPCSNRASKSCALSRKRSLCDIIFVKSVVGSWRVTSMFSDLRRWLWHKESDHTCVEHKLDIHPCMSGRKKFGSIATGDSHQFLLSSWMKGQIRCNIVHLAVKRGPCIILLVCLKH